MNYSDHSSNTGVLCEKSVFTMKKLTTQRIFRMIIKIFSYHEPGSAEKKKKMLRRMLYKVVISDNTNGYFQPISIQSAEMR